MTVALASWDSAWSPYVDNWEEVRSDIRDIYGDAVHERVVLVAEAWTALALDQNACGISEWDEIATDNELGEEDQEGWDGIYSTIQSQAIASLDPMDEMLSEAGLTRVVECSYGEDCSEEVQGWFRAAYGDSVACHTLGESLLCRISRDVVDIGSGSLPGSSVRYLEVISGRSYEIGSFHYEINGNEELLLRGGIRVGALSGWVPELASLVGALGRVDLQLRAALLDLQLRPLCNLKPSVVDRDWPSVGQP
jgi:hypothetical protein